MQRLPPPQRIFFLKSPTGGFYSKLHQTCHKSYNGDSHHPGMFNAGRPKNLGEDSKFE